MTTENPAFDPASNLLNLSERDARTVAEGLAAAGGDTKAINDALKSRGFAELDASPAAQASRTLDRLKRSPEWLEKFHSGDAAALAEFDRLTLAMSQGTAVQAPATLKAEDYRFTPHYVKDANAQDAARFAKETSEWAAKLQLPVGVTTAISQDVLDNIAHCAGMSPDQKENWGREQETILRSVVAKTGDPDTRFKEAQATIKKQSGLDLPIAEIARANGADVALELVLHADALTRRR